MKRTTLLLVLASVCCAGCCTDTGCGSCFCADTPAKHAAPLTAGEAELGRPPSAGGAQ